MTTHLYILSPYLKYSLAKVRHNILILVLIPDDNSEVGAHVQSDLGYLNLHLRICICLHREQSQIRPYLKKQSAFHQTCVLCAELPSSISTMLETMNYSASIISIFMNWKIDKKP